MPLGAKDSTSYIYVIARSPKTGRPGCQHIMAFGSRDGKALCGYDYGHVSRSYSNEAIDVILCRRCEQIN